jgi:hypothetical protein
MEGMSEQLQLDKYSVGVGDRFAHQAEAQLRACVLASEHKVDVIPVWNKSNREHNIIGSEPSSVRAAVESAVRKLHWDKPYYVDADHINFETVDRFLAASDFYTIDVADWIGKPATPADINKFVNAHPELSGRVEIPGTSSLTVLDRHFVTQSAVKYLAAVKEAKRIYRKIEQKKGTGQFIAEISMDETDRPQTPAELLVILAAVAEEKIPIQTIAPKFTGRFNKGVDYEGDLPQFTEEFANDIATIAFAVHRYGLPPNLKLSVHSGSDKFSIYPAMRQALKRFDAGVHLKTAGTTWLEELIGLAEASPEGLALAKEIYSQAYSQREALCEPYAAVIAIDSKKLPDPETLQAWTSEHFVSALRHDPKDGDFNSSLRQLLHVAFKIAANMGARYLDLVRQSELTIARNVTANLFYRHIKPVFIGA